jgi:hypothetical protein
VRWKNNGFPCIVCAAAVVLRLGRRYGDGTFQKHQVLSFLPHQGALRASPCVWQPRIFRTIGFLRTRPAIPVTQITQLFGGTKAKFGGLKHIYVYYLATPTVKLYEPFNNRECLHCHAGAPSFEEGAVHTADADLLPAIKANKHSCLSSGCHETVHDVKTLKEQKFWKGAG